MCRRVFTVEIVNRHHREGPVAIARGVVGLLGWDHLRTVACRSQASRSTYVGKGGCTGEVLPDDLRVLPKSICLALNDARLDRGTSRRRRGHGSNIPVDRATTDRAGA